MDGVRTEFKSLLPGADSNTVRVNVEALRIAKTAEDWQILDDERDRFARHSPRGCALSANTV